MTLARDGVCKCHDYQYVMIIKLTRMRDMVFKLGGNIAK